MKDAQEIFKDRPEAAKKLVEAITKACSDCKIAAMKDEDLAKRPEKRGKTDISFPTKLTHCIVQSTGLTLGLH